MNMPLTREDPTALPSGAGYTGEKPGDGYPEDLPAGKHLVVVKRIRGPIEVKGYNYIFADMEEITDPKSDKRGRRGSLRFLWDTLQHTFASGDDGWRGMGLWIDFLEKCGVQRKNADGSWRTEIPVTDVVGKIVQLVVRQRPGADRAYPERVLPATPAQIADAADYLAYQDAKATLP
jgi:hypothetical protein